MLGEHGIQHDTPEGRRQFECRMEARPLAASDEAALSAFRRSWLVGSEEFRQQMLQRMEDKLGEHHAGQLHRESAEVKAQRLLAEELRRLGWTEQELEARPKSDPAKLCIAARLRKETTLSIKAIAGLVHLGTSKAPTPMHAPPPNDSRQKRLGT